jgi:hypothetical protein
LKIVNPKLGKFDEGLQLEEPFMLWCSTEKRYHMAIARLWSDACSGADSTDIVVGSTQLPDHILSYFTVGNLDKYGNDLFKNMNELLQLFKYDRYHILYK